MSSPLISVLMPVKNARRYLHDSIAGVLTQTHADFELLLIDDYSDDRSLSVCNSYARSDRRIIVLQNQTSGVAAALNFGIAHAKGVYMARIDADDVCVPSRFERQIAVLQANPEIAVVGTWARVVDGQGVEIGSLTPPTQATNIRSQLLSSNCVIHPSVMARLAVVKDIGGYRPVFEGCEDYDLWLRIATVAGICNLNEMLLCYRMHDAQVSWQRVEQRILSELAAARFASSRDLEQRVDLGKIKAINRETLLVIGFKPQEIDDALQIRTIGTALEAIRFKQYRTAQSILAKLEIRREMPFKRLAIVQFLRTFLYLRSYLYGSS